MQVTFVLTKYYLIFTYSGEHFSEKDVQGISDATPPDRDKTKDPNTTGHKGIGFRSVFNISECVIVLSSETTFCFDKSHTKWANNPDDYPWPIIPIWIDRELVAEELKKHYSSDMACKFHTTIA